MTHHDSMELPNNVLSVVNDSNLITYLFAHSFHSQSTQQQQLYPPNNNTDSPSSSPPSTASINASSSDLDTNPNITDNAATTIMPHTSNASHHNNTTSRHHHHRAPPLPPSIIVEPSIPAACASLLSLRTGGCRPHTSPSDGSLPMLTTALTLLEHATSNPKRNTAATAKSSGSRFWDTVLPMNTNITKSAPNRTRNNQLSSTHTPSSSTTNGSSHTTPSNRNRNTTGVSAEDESAKMNIPCVVCGVRFRKPGHLNMHWRSVHATSPDAVYPGKLQAKTSTNVLPSAATTTTTASAGGSAGGGSRIAKGKTVRPYGCPQCSSRFRRGSDRNRHMRMVHAKIRPFECSQCGSHFGRKSFLEAHISTVHEKQRPFRCHCGAAFGQRSSLTRHARKIHGPS